MRAKSDATTTSPAGADSVIDAELIRHLAKLVSTSDLAEIEVEKGDLRIRVTRHHSTQGFAPSMPMNQTVATVQPLPSVPAPVVAPAADQDFTGMVKSPMVGTVYRRQNPGSKPFVEIGSLVKAGDRVLLVEAMKTFNDIVAHRSGTVAAILVEDSQPVEYGEHLLLIE